MFPLFETYSRFPHQVQQSDPKNPLSDDYYELRINLENLSKKEGVACFDDFLITYRFLSDYRHSEETFNRLRSECQRFLLYIWLITKSNLSESNEAVLEGYLDFLKSPEDEWVGSSNRPAFVSSEGKRIPNSNWRPFTNRATHGLYRITQSSVDSAYRTLSMYFQFLSLQHYINYNPVPGVRKSKRKAKQFRLESNDTNHTLSRLTDWQWYFALDVAHAMADESPRYERNLFVFVTLKLLYLRVGDLAPRRDATGKLREPVFGDFRRTVIQGETFWELYVFSKGLKHRFVPLPDQYIHYLKRYRQHLNLPPMPVKGETVPIMPDSKGRPIGRRQIARSIEGVFEAARYELYCQGYQQEYEDMLSVGCSTHYLRHTGASMDVESGRDLRSVAEDLGHSDTSLADKTYVNKDRISRYLSGRGRVL